MTTGHILATDTYKGLTMNSQILTCLFLLTNLVTISAQSTCTHLTAMEGSNNFITSPNYPNNYNSDTRKCWIIEAHYPSHRVKLDSLDFHLEPDPYCTNDYLEIREGSNAGRLINKYCSSRGPRVTSTGRTLYLRFTTDLTDTDRGFKLMYTSIQGDTPDNDANQNEESEESSTDWTSSPNLHLLIIACSVAFVLLICSVAVVVAFKADKTPKKKKRNQEISYSTTSSQQELTTNIQIDHTTHNETAPGSYSTIPSAPPVHYGNANPSSQLDTLPPSYTVAIRGDGPRDGPYLAYEERDFSRY